MRAMLVAIVMFACSAPALAGPDCPADIDGSGEVGFRDLIGVLSTWGPCAGCAQDLDGDGIVGFSDLLLLLATWGPCPFTALELAGNPLAEYPHFEYVRAFNEGAPVHLALDPHRFPVAGRAALVYIVAARTASEWDADPELIDVRGTPQPVLFGGPDIQDATILLDGGRQLSSDAGTGLGAGYDLVLDFDSDGQLSPGDFIDGYGDESGLSIVHDLAAPGPLDVSVIQYDVAGITSGLDAQRTWYPTGISTLGELPLIVVSHGGGGGFFSQFDYLQMHLASYGCIVMSHQNNTTPGVFTASTTTLEHTDAVIDQQGRIADGVLDGHIDANRIVWIGFSRGGEGVVVAFDRLVDGTYIPDHFTASDIRLISAVAPTVFGDAASTDPHDVPFHLLWGSADGDVDGSAGCDICQSFKILERAAGSRHSTYVQGMDHYDLTCCGFDDFEGPPGTAIGREEAQRVARALWLALVKHYLEDNLPATDYLWRPWERFRPLGVSAETIVDLEFGKPSSSERFVIDDFQAEPSLSISSSGGSVSFTVQNLTEGVMNDNNTSFTWIGSDPMNGMTRASSSDAARGLVFDYAEASFLEFEIIEEERNLSDHAYLSFRACQGTRHPLTVAALEDLTFTVTLRDGDGTESSINIGVYGGGIEEPYQRTGAGTGAGWQNEFETIRIRLTDFTHNRPDLNLTNIEAVRFDFGGPFGSDVGRLGFDDLEVSGG